MNGVSRKSKRKTSRGSPSVTSSRGSGAGHLRSSSQDGRARDQSGQDHAPASRSARRESATVKKTKGTSGQSGLSCSEGIPLSASESLSLYLVSRLRQRLGTAGSMEYAQTWKEKATPLGMRYWEHTASGHRTSGNDCTGWQSPVAGDAKGVAYRRDGGQKGKERLTNLGLVAGWPTASATDGERGGEKTENMTGTSLQQVAALSGWHTPDTAPSAPCKGSNCKNVIAGLGNQVIGTTSTSSPAETEKRGVLNPEFVAWLMGYPEEWVSSGVSAMQSCQR